jgi:hypothetical protein
MRSRIIRAAVETVGGVGAAMVVLTFVPTSWPAPLRWTIAAAAVWGMLLGIRAVAPERPTLPTPPPGRRYATTTSWRDPSFHKTLQEAKNALRPKRTRRWAQRVWPEGSVFEWQDGDWHQIYAASQEFTRRGM